MLVCHCQSLSRSGESALQSLILIELPRKSSGGVKCPLSKKGGEPAKTTQVMSGQLFKMVKKYFGMIPDQHYLFVWGGKRITPNAVWKRVKLIRQKAGFDFSLHPHMLKHSLGKYLAEATNGNTLDIMQALGHKNIKNTMTYVAGYQSPRKSYF